MDPFLGIFSCDVPIDAPTNCMPPASFSDPDVHGAVNSHSNSKMAVNFAYVTLVTLGWSSFCQTATSFSKASRCFAAVSCPSCPQSRTFTASRIQCNVSGITQVQNLHCIQIQC